MAHQLKTNTDTLQDILDIANSLPEAGSSGSSIETCTVTIKTDNDIYESESFIESIVTRVVEEGTIRPFVFSTQASSNIDTYTIQNVVCGDIISVVYYMGLDSTPYYYIDGNASYVESLISDSIYKAHPTIVYSAPTTQGETCTITADYSV